MFENITNLNKEISEEIYKKCIQIGIIKKEKFNKEVSPEFCEFIAMKNLVSPPVLAAFVEKFEGKEIDVTNFGNEINDDETV